MVREQDCKDAYGDQPRHGVCMALLSYSHFLILVLEMTDLRFAQGHPARAIVSYLKVYHESLPNRQMKGRKGKQGEFMPLVKFRKGTCVKSDSDCPVSASHWSLGTLYLPERHCRCNECQDRGLEISAYLSGPDKLKGPWSRNFQKLYQAELHSALNLQKDFLSC